MAEEKTNKGNKGVWITVLIVIIVAVVAFWGGMQYQRSQIRRQFAQFGGETGGGQFGRRNGGPGANGQRPVSGDIISSDDKSVTIKLPDGSSKIIILSGSTAINKTTKGSKDDLKNGVRISALGTANSDGSITAQNIFIGGGMFRGGTRPTGQ